MTSRERAALKELVSQRRRELLGPEPKCCAGCGGDYESLTRSCRTCMDRHHNRKTRNARNCAKCGCEFSERTTGCSTCRERHKKRTGMRNWERERVYARERRARLKAA